MVFNIKRQDHAGGRWGWFFSGKFCSRSNAGLAGSMLFRLPGSGWRGCTFPATARCEQEGDACYTHENCSIVRHCRFTWSELA